MSSMMKKKFRSQASQARYEKTLAGRYEKLYRKHHLWVFGIPFIAALVGGSFLLSNFTATRYEQHDQKVREVDEETQLSILGNRKPVDMKEQYYQLQGLMEEHQDWEPKRVPRLEGESENKW
ncbi:hypothetical protein BABINDRAFT_15465 [Babjeviella inositovora NRRL Y-12698]|uniref:Cytochrome c oxidase assembly protein COX16, mitochondrial n=1 Tax=Babjeviella inositovora NRRL Y-12698 TaxID=984486 RepID=A0A1E3QIP5_9ASCO|nr:uncharacterized protein BABINDRAFT_15465 [Babjeviella inositovora NRRL Y-12698]ODQ77478.1 hypothetical protein BABINDRAFT_15465 [Babjeviella inositovora NRRL Y-12698]